MVEESVDLEYVSLHGCIRDISSYAEDLAENQLGTVRSLGPSERKI